MAIVYEGPWNGFTQDQFADVFSNASGKLQSVAVTWENLPQLTIDGWNFYDENSDDFAFFGLGNQLHARALGGVSYYGAYVGAASSNAKLVGTRNAVAFMNTDANGRSVYGIIIALDTNGDLAVIVSSGSNPIWNSPYVVRNHIRYISAISLNITASDQFNETSFETVPVPALYDSPRKCTDVMFAHATTTDSDGEIVLNGTKWYSIGGALMLRDYD